jgi:hypothetical protein
MAPTTASPRSMATDCPNRIGVVRSGGRSRAVCDHCTPSLEKTYAAPVVNALRAPTMMSPPSMSTE